MNNVGKLLLKCIDCYVNNKKLNIGIDFDESSWYEFYLLSQNQSLLPISYEMISNHESYLKQSDHIKETWRKLAITTIMVQVNKSSAFLKLYTKIRNAKIDCIVFKGIVLRQLYQKREWRTSGDEDILIKSESFDKLHRILVENNFNVENSTYIDNLEVVSYNDVTSGLHLEVHKFLFPTNSIYKPFNNFFKNVFEKKYEILVDGISIQVMIPQMQLLYLICHAFKHFVNRGVGLRQIMDIGMYSRKYYREINWQKLFEQVDLFNGRNFVHCIYCVLNYHMGILFEEINYPITQFSDNFNYDYFLNDVLSGGVYGKAEMNRGYSHLVTNNVSHSKKIRIVRKILFPSKETLQQSYPILNRHPYLLLYIWIKRGIRFIIRYCKERRNRDVDVKSIIACSKKRLDLLKKYEIIK